jgi:hypothetical protein
MVADERVYVAASQEGGYPQSLVIDPEDDTGGMGESPGSARETPTIRMEASKK